MEITARPTVTRASKPARGESRRRQADGLRPGALGEGHVVVWVGRVQGRGCRGSRVRWCARPVALLVLLVLLVLLMLLLLPEHAVRLAKRRVLPIVRREASAGSTS